jgi:hypothetical protein
MAENDTVEAQADSQGKETETPKKIRFHYLKSNAFRSVHADGVFGGVTPRLSISATFFNERQPIPDQVVQAVKEDGTVGEELTDERIARDGFVRELEVNVIMDLALAKAMQSWLAEKIKTIEERIEEAKREKEVA